MGMTPEEAADRYERWVWKTGLGEASKKVYAQRVRTFLAWLVEQGEEYAEALVDEDVRDYACRDYRRKLLATDKKAPATVAQAMSALGSFYDWLELGKPRGVSVEVQASGKKGLTEDELRKVLRACQRRSVRDFALAQVLFQSGVRVDECAAIDTDDVHITERTGQLLVRYGKGGKPRTVPLSAQAREAIRAWLEERKTMKGAADSKALFLSSRGDRLAVRSIQDVMQKAGEAAGVHLSPHVLRHTFGRRSVENGTDLEALRQLMGHKSIQTTAGYTQPRWENLQDAVERVGIDL